MPLRHRGSIATPFLTSGLNGSDPLMPWPLHPQGKTPWYSMDRGSSGSQGEFGYLVWKRKWQS